MSWVSSSFDDIAYIGTTKRKINDKFDKSSKKRCINLWVSEYPPSSSEDLAVHKKKLQEVQNWLMEHKNSIKDRKFLLLSGPPGSSKSAAIHVLAKEMHFSLIEWHNSSSSRQGQFHENFVEYAESGNYEFQMTQSQKFSEFLFRSSRYNNLCSSKPTNHNLILFEELPNVFLMNPTEFHEILRKYAASCKTAVVFVCSDSNKDNTVKSLFPPELQEEISITNIAFNPVSSSLLQNALNRILQLSSLAQSPFFDSVSKKQFLQMVADKSGGDVRSAVNTLQFLMMQDFSENQEFGVRGKRKHRAKEKGSLPTGDLVGIKDSSLVLFRALGKVLYCKREKFKDLKKGASLPPSLKIHERDPAIEDPNDVFERSGVTSSTFSLFLHHNCIPFLNDINEFSAAVDYLSDADIFSSTWDPSNTLDVYSSTVSIRGMMHSLRGGSKGSQQFRSLTRPSWYNCIRTSQERLLKSRNIHKNLPITNEELSTVYIPLLSKIPSTSVSAEKFIQDVGLMYPSPLSKSCSQNSSSLSQTQKSSHDVEDDEEFFIEEVED